jgi:hypothetical protein
MIHHGVWLIERRWIFQTAIRCSRDFCLFVLSSEFAGYPCGKVSPSDFSAELFAFGFQAYNLYTWEPYISNLQTKTCRPLEDRRQ